MSEPSSVNFVLHIPYHDSIQQTLPRLGRSIVRMFCSPAFFHFSRYAFEPTKLGLKLLDHQAHHPHRFMIRMPDFFQNGTQHFLFAHQFLFQIVLPPLDLLLKHTRPRLPGKRDPRQKRRTVALRGPFFTFESIGQRRAPFGSRFKAASLRSRSRLTHFERTNHPGPRQFFEGIVNLRPRDPRPISYLAPLQLRVRLIPMHRPLRQQTQQHQIRRGQRQFLSRANLSLQSLRAPLGSLGLSVIFFFSSVSVVISLGPLLVPSFFYSTTTTGTSP